MEKDFIKTFLNKTFEIKKNTNSKCLGLGHLLQAFMICSPNSIDVNLPLDHKKIIKNLNKFNTEYYAKFSEKEEITKGAKQILNDIERNSFMFDAPENLQKDLVGRLICDSPGLDEFFSSFFNYLRRNHVFDNIFDNDLDDFNNSDEIDEELAEYLETPTLKEFNSSENLDKIKGLYNVNEKVFQRSIHIVGRNKETEEAFTTLSKKVKANILLLGEAGVGKTAVVEKMAEMINNGNVLDNFKNTTIYELSISELLAGTKYRGEFEEKFTKILNAVMKEENIILFIDEIHNAVKAGAGEDSSNSVMEMLKPYLSRSDLRVIGATTYDEYRKIFSKNKATDRRFEVINVLEPTKEETLGILKGVKGSYEAFHNIDISDEILPVIINYSEKYISNKKFPDKALDILDYICARAKNEKREIDNSLVTEAVEKIANVKLKSNLTKENFETEIKKIIMGQDEAISEVSEMINLLNLGIVDKNKPLASFLLTGPTGVGKTELAKQIAKVYFGSEEKIIKIDMSDYPEKHDVAKLTGATPGYVGYSDGSLLLNSVKKQPYSVILLDEIEKAHPDILNIFLQILDDGFLTSAEGEKIDFRNTMIIMTSNLGFHQSDSKMITLGATSNENTKKVVDFAVKNYFKPEFLNRVDKIICFNRLNKEVIKNIAENYMSKFGDYKLDDNELELLIKEAEVDTYGARAIQKVVRTKILPLKVTKEKVS